MKKKSVCACSGLYLLELSRIHIKFSCSIQLSNEDVKFASQLDRWSDRDRDTRVLSTSAPV